MRIFIAINLEQEISDALEKLIHKLKDQSVQGNFTRKENLHITLIFIGETSRIKPIKEVMDSIKVLPGTFKIKIKGLGKFPRAGGDIYWLGVEKSNELDTIYEELTTKLRAIGFDIEKRPFKPHLTLGRKVVLKKDFEYRTFEKCISPLSIKVTKISLMKSERISGKLTYTEIYSRKLG
jgi:2'-5' RNA ligase